jgi:hypothetical protein
MKSNPPVLTQTSVASVAAKRAARAKRRLREAETQLRESDSALSKSSAAPMGADVKDALAHNAAAEASIQDAREELEVVEELLANAEPSSPQPQEEPKVPSTQGKSGEGAKSAIPHLRRSGPG